MPVRYALIVHKHSSVNEVIWNLSGVHLIQWKQNCDVCYTLVNYFHKTKGNLIYIQYIIFLFT